MASVQPGTMRGIVLQRMGSRKTVPPRMLRIVPFGESHIFFSLNSETYIQQEHGLGYYARQGWGRVGCVGSVYDAEDPVKLKSTTNITQIPK